MRTGCKCCPGMAYAGYLSCVSSALFFLRYLMYETQNEMQNVTTAAATAATMPAIMPELSSFFGAGTGTVIFFGGGLGGGGAFGKSTDTVCFAVATFAFIVDASANWVSVASALDEPPPPPSPTSATAVLTSDPCITADTDAADAIIASGVDAASMSVFKTVAAADESLATAAVAAELGLFASVIAPSSTAFSTEVFTRDSTVSSDARSKDGDDDARSVRMRRAPAARPLASTTSSASARTT